MGAGAEVVVQGHRLVLKPLTPIPALRKGMPLHPDDPDDPRVFRVDFSALGLGMLPVVFTGAGNDGRRQGLLLDLMAFDKRADRRNPRRLVAAGVLSAGAVGITSKLAWRASHRREPPLNEEPC
jgi:hypothetical protein